MQYPNFHYRRQRGAALVVSLIFMLILTIIGTSALRSTTLQEKMAGNTRDINAAFQAAEAALRAGELVLQGAAVGPFNGSAGLYRQCSGSGSACNPPEWTSSGASGWASVSDYSGGASSLPQYYIEQLPPIADPQAPLDADTPQDSIEMYRVTARGFGVSDTAMVVLQSMYRRD